MELKGGIVYFKRLRLRFSLNVIYLKLLLWLIISIALEHTCSEAEEIENGH
ncbi:MAG: hypothetical protein K0M40_02305 [Prolixibacteraceae bacterium]|nr:hypothetical protein [Prolixibacteraceae bacterium]